MIGFRALVVLSTSIVFSFPGMPAFAGNTEESSFPVSINWLTGTGKWKGQWGRRETLRCPPGGNLESIWGTDIYTDDSSVCTAAIHAGLISRTTGGVVTIEVRPDHWPYHGSTRNGIRSGSWTDHWPGSFIFIRIPAQSTPPAIQASGALQADSWLGQPGRVVTLLCPPKFELHTVFGTDVYTGDSYVCSAAVHAGVTTQAKGGMVTIKILEGRDSYSSSTRNGVTSMSNGTYAGSFTFIPTPTGVPPPPTESAPVPPAPETFPHEPPTTSIIERDQTRLSAAK